MRKVFLSILLLTFYFFTNCGHSQNRDNGQYNKTWSNFIQTVKELQSHDSTTEYPNEKFYHAQKLLDMEKHDFNYWGKIIVADSPYTEAMVKPEPEVWKVNDQILVCSADLYGDTHREYAFGMGWMGPAGGILCIYDSLMRKLAEVETYCLWRISLRDLTNEGKNEILCWSDEHHGTGEWFRYLTIYGYYKNLGLKILWEGKLYNEALNCIDKYEIEINKENSKSAVIFKKHVFSQYHNGLDTTVYYKKLEPMETFHWNSVNKQFEK